MNSGHAIDRLKQALRRLPGVGPKTAQRMAFYLLERDREGASALADALREAIAECRTLSSAAIISAKRNCVRNLCFGKA